MYLAKFAYIALIFLIQVYFILQLGYYIKRKLDKKRKISFIFPLGIIAIIGLSHLFLVLCIVLGLSFKVQFNIYTIIIINALYYIVKDNKVINIIKQISTFEKKVLIIGLILGIYFAFTSIPMGDTWLFNAMVSGNIQNNIINGSDGLAKIGKFPIEHRYDTYYILLSNLSIYYHMEPYVYLCTMSKLVDGMAIISVGAFAFSRVLPKKRLPIILYALGIGLGISFLTMYPTNPEQTAHMGSGSNGTILLISVFIPSLFILYTQSTLPVKEKKLAYLLVSLFGLSVSSSAIFILACSALTLLVSDFMGQITNNFEHVLILLASSIFGLSLWIGNTSLLVAICGLVLSAFMLMLSFLILATKLSNGLKLKLVNYTCLIGGLIFLLLIFIQSDSVIYMLHGAINADEVLMFNNLGERAPRFVFYPFILLIFIWGMLMLKQKNSKVYEYIILNLLLFSNPLSYTVFGSVIGQLVYHRVMVMAMFFIPIIYCIIQLINGNKKLAISFIVTLIIIANPVPKIYTSLLAVSKTNTILDFKLNDPDLSALLKFDFAKSNDVAFILKDNPVQGEDTLAGLSSQKMKWKHTPSHLYQVKSHLDWVPICTYDCYLIYPKDTAYEDYIVSNKGQKVYATENYQVIYVK